MATHKNIDEFLEEDCGGKFKDKTWLLGFFGSVIYTPTGEKVAGGFRYFSCEVAPVIQAFEARDIGAMLALPYALDDDGEPDTSTVLVSLHYTPSGSALAIQVQEYQNSEPIPVSPVWLMEGAEAQSFLAQVKELDQSN